MIKVQEEPDAIDVSSDARYNLIWIDLISRDVYIGLRPEIALKLAYSLIQIVNNRKDDVVSINPFSSEMTHKKILEEYRIWYKSYHTGRSGQGLRFGQHICNLYLREGMSCPDVYYEENASKVFGKIIDLIGE